LGEFVRKLVEQAKIGDMQAIRELFDRMLRQVPTAAPDVAEHTLPDTLTMEQRRAAQERIARRLGALPG
jgi:hypothetical protein